MEWYYAEGDEQHGPVTESVLIGLVEQGIIRADTLVWNDSMTDWLPYGEVHAQSESLRTSETVVTPAPAALIEGEKTEPLAIASLVLAILSIVICVCGFFFSLAAIVCGHIALNRINAAEGRLAGRRLALVGLVIAYITLALTAIGTIFSLLSTILGMS